MYSFSVLTSSDSCSAGKKDDKSGSIIKEMLSSIGWNFMKYKLVPDTEGDIQSALTDMLDGSSDLIITTGGTGLSPRDVTPEATRRIIEREVPGISEAIRYFGMKKTPFAMLSRGISGIHGSTLIINLPGSPKAVREGLEILAPILPHALDKLGGDTRPCAENI